MLRKFSISVVALVTTMLGSLEAGNLFCCNDAFNYGYGNDGSSWTGFYIGANVGVDWARNRHSDNSVGFNLKSSEAGGVYGGFFGYNFQDCNNVVYSIEASFDGTSLKRSRSTTLTFTDVLNNPNPPPATQTIVLSTPVSAKSKIDWFGTITPRIGFNFCNWLLFFKGGAVYARFDDRFSIGPSTSVATPSTPPPPAGIASTVFSQKKTEWGGTFGIGVDYNWGCGWFAGLEFNYFTFGKRHVNGSFVDNTTTPATTRTVNDKVRHEGGDVVFRLGYLF